MLRIMPWQQWEKNYLGFRMPLSNNLQDPLAPFGYICNILVGRFRMNIIGPDQNGKEFYFCAVSIAGIKKIPNRILSAVAAGKISCTSAPAQTALRDPKRTQAKMFFLILCDFDAGTGADAVGARGYHGLCRLPVADAAGCLHTHLIAYRAAHKFNVGNRCSAHA